MSGKPTQHTMRHSATLQMGSVGLLLPIGLSLEATSLLRECELDGLLTCIRLVAIYFFSMFLLLFCIFLLIVNV